MKYNIIFSIPIHEKFEVVIDQIVNFFYFNPNCAIVYHISQGFNYKGSSLTKECFLDIVKSIGNVYINPESVRTGRDDIIQAHLSNFKYVEDNFDFGHFCLCASNELFFKHGLFKYIEPFDCGLECLDVLSSENREWVAGLKAQQDLELKEYLKKKGGCGIFGSHVEGSYYRKELFSEVIKEIESFYDYHFMTFPYPRDEIYFSSVIYAMKESGKKLKIKEDGLFSWSRWHSLMDLKVWSWDVGRLQKKGNVYSLKRVERDINANLRMYMRKYLGYANVVHTYVPETLEKSCLSTFFSDIVDYSIECCRMIYRRIRRLYWRHSGYYQNV